MSFYHHSIFVRYKVVTFYVKDSWRLIALGWKEEDFLKTPVYSFVGTSCHTDRLCLSWGQQAHAGSLGKSTDSDWGAVSITWPLSLCLCFDFQAVSELFRSQLRCTFCCCFCVFFSPLWAAGEAALEIMQMKNLAEHPLAALTPSSCFLA